MNINTIRSFRRFSFMLFTILQTIKIIDQDEGQVQSISLPCTNDVIVDTSSAGKRQSKKSASSKRATCGVFSLSPPSPHRIMTLTHKNFVQIFRNIGLVFFFKFTGKLYFQSKQFSLTIKRVLYSFNIFLSPFF